MTSSGSGSSVQDRGPQVTWLSLRAVIPAVACQAIRGAMLAGASTILDR